MFPAFSKLLRSERGVHAASPLPCKSTSKRAEVRAPLAFRAFNHSEPQLKILKNKL
jgi:hypothetical protein